MDSDDEYWAEDGIRPATFNVVEAVARLTIARSQLHFATVATSISEDHQSVLTGWFDRLTERGIEEPERLGFAASVTLDLDEVAWRVVGPTSVMLERIADACGRIGATEPATQRFGEIGNTLRPHIVGMGVQVGGAGTDAEWIIPESVGPEEFDGVHVPPPFADYLASDDADLIAVSGGLGNTAHLGGMRRLVPGPDQSSSVDDVLVLVMSAYGSAHVDPPPAGILVAISELHRGPFTTSRWLSETGTVKFGVGLVDPSIELLLALASTQTDGSSSDDRLAEFVATLGAATPSLVEVESWLDTIRIRAHVEVTEPA